MALRLGFEKWRFPRCSAFAWSFRLRWEASADVSAERSAPTESCVATAAPAQSKSSSSWNCDLGQREGAAEDCRFEISTSGGRAARLFVHICPDAVGDLPH